MAFKRLNEIKMDPEVKRFWVRQWSYDHSDCLCVMDRQTGRQVPATFRTGFHVSFVAEAMKLADLLNNLYEQSLDNKSES